MMYYRQDMWLALIIVTAFILDCLIGDPQNPYHPMRAIGKFIALGIRLLGSLKPKSHAAQFTMGVVMSLIVVSVSFALTWLLMWGLYRLNIWVGLCAEVILCYFLIAPKALRDESMLVYRALVDGDILCARKNLSFIVGRDTQDLNAGDMVRATVETVSENLSDGVIAPLIFTAIGGAPLGMALKAVNTLDSMVGYRNVEFEWFGKFAARLDDVVNFIPSRVSAFLLIFGSLFTGWDTKGAVRVYIRDRYSHKSPNSAQTESACAGALGLALGGDSYYKGELVRKPTIGDGINEPVPKHIVAANRLMYAATICSVVLFASIRLIFDVLV